MSTNSVTISTINGLLAWECSRRLAGRFQGRFVEWMNVPVSDRQYYTSLAIGGVTSLILSKLYDEKTPEYKINLLRVASIALSTISAPCLARALPTRFGIVITWETAAVLGMIHLFREMMNICLKYLFSMAINPLLKDTSFIKMSDANAAFWIDQSILGQIPDSLEEVRKLDKAKISQFYEAFKRNEDAWKGIHFCTRVIFNRHFVNNDLEALSFADIKNTTYASLLPGSIVPQLGFLNNEENEFLRNHTHQIDLSPDDRTKLNDYFYLLNESPQQRATDGELPRFLRTKLADPNDIDNLCPRDLLWCHHFLSKIQSEEIRNAIEDKCEETLLQHLV